MTYLVLRISTVGNVAMTVPILSSLSEQYPDDRFVVVSRKRLAPLFYGLGNVCFHQADLDSRSLLKSIIQLYRELSRYHIDAVIDLQDSWRTRFLRAVFAWNHHPVYTINLGSSDIQNMILTGYRGRALPSEFRRYSRAFAQAGLIADDRFTSLAVDKEAQAAIRERYGVKTGRWLGIAPFAKYSSNRLPLRVIKEVMAHYTNDANMRIFLFGWGEIESEQLRQWAGLYPNVISTAGLLPLQQELELMRQLDVMLCMDSANQHLASLVGTRVVSVWCATHPALGFYGWKQDPDDCIQLDLACRPCTAHGTEHCRFRNFECKQCKSNLIWQKLFP